MWRSPAFLFKPTVELVKQLRFSTEAPISECHAALTESNGDLASAIEWLNTRGAARYVAHKKRCIGSGVVLAALDCRYGGAAVTLCTETDFSTRTEHFAQLVIAVQKYIRKQISETHGDILDIAEFREEVTKNCSAALAHFSQVCGESVCVQAVDTLCAKKLKVVEKDWPSVVFGEYTHPSVPNASFGSTVGIAALHVREDSSLFLDNLRNEFAQHIVSQCGNVNNLAQQYFLGSEVSVGKWLKIHKARYGGCLVAKYGEETLLNN